MRASFARSAQLANCGDPRAEAQVDARTEAKNYNFGAAPWRRKRLTLAASSKNHAVSLFARRLELLGALLGRAT